MEISEIIPFAMGERNKGSLNQILGAFKALSELTGQFYDTSKLFLLPPNVSDVNNLKEAIFHSQDSDYMFYSQSFCHSL